MEGFHILLLLPVNKYGPLDLQATWDWFLSQRLVLQIGNIRLLLFSACLRCYFQVTFSATSKCSHNEVWGKQDPSFTQSRGLDDSYLMT